MIRHMHYSGHFSGFFCQGCYRRLARSEFYLPSERRYLEQCRACTAQMQKRARKLNAA
ncbi:hypothetical protein SAMN02745127_02529 [Oceanospirillum multiglobuliferum]|uniref:hypothetical protein n=1 Tax=Oceanospirillum multiglobuliferum TaxID=64969 RepID=UPI0009C5C659|nr:hypothetical protein [Oceanospirillum multiglobuliferum]SKA18376.1 hypothetical protein SAMN02745127_02529 [Oceanospirillum multiglobuliferum]